MKKHKEMQDLQDRKKAEVERETRKAHALEEEKAGVTEVCEIALDLAPDHVDVRRLPLLADIEMTGISAQDRKLMLDKIRREQAALYNNHKEPPVHWRPVNEEKTLVSFARSIGYNTRKL